MRVKHNRLPHSDHENHSPAHKALKSQLKCQDKGENIAQYDYSPATFQKDAGKFSFRIPKRIHIGTGTKQCLGPLVGTPQPDTKKRVFKMGILDIPPV